MDPDKIILQELTPEIPPPKEFQDLSPCSAPAPEICPPEEFRDEPVDCIKPKFSSLQYKRYTAEKTAVCKLVYSCY